jgi:hypothetical protein
VPRDGGFDGGQGLRGGLWRIVPHRRIVLEFENRQRIGRVGNRKAPDSDIFCTGNRPVWWRREYIARQHRQDCRLKLLDARLGIF